MKRPKTRLEKLIIVGVAVMIIGLAVGVVGIVLDEARGEDALSLGFLIGGVSGMLVGSAVCCTASGILTKRRKRENLARALSVSEDSFVIFDKVVTFTAAGAVFSEKNVFEEDAQEAYDVTVYRVIKRKSPAAKGKDAVLVKIPDRPFEIFGEGSDDGGYILWEPENEEAARFMRTAERRGIPVLDRRGEAAQKPTPVKKFSYGGRNRAKAIAVAVVGTVLFVGAGIGLGLLIQNYTGGSSGVICGVIGGVSAPFILGLFQKANVGATLVLYENGILIKSPAHGGGKRFYSREELESARLSVAPDGAFIVFDFGYCTESFLDTGGVFEEIEGLFPEKCIKEQLKEEGQNEE